MKNYLYACKLFYSIRSNEMESGSASSSAFLHFDSSLRESMTERCHSRN